MAIPSGIIREDVLRAMEELDGGIEHAFGAPWWYAVVHQGRKYAPKAVPDGICPETFSPWKGWCCQR